MEQRLNARRGAEGNQESRISRGVDPGVCGRAGRRRTPAFRGDEGR